jgi:hypothetical protein
LGVLFIRQHFLRRTIMKDSRKYGRLVVVGLCFLAALVVCTALGSADDIRADGEYTLFVNGDLAVAFKMTPPMKIYQVVREGVSNPYLVLRWLSSSRATAEAVDPKVDFDDATHSINFSARFLGSARNLGNHWELDAAKGTDFINLDEAKKIFFFNETSPAGAMGTIRGTSRLIMPDEAQQIKWDASRHLVTYVLSPQGASSGRNSNLLIWGVVLMVFGAGLTVGSFLLKA